MPAFAGDIGAERETHVLLAMQKVEGSNPFSRFAPIRLYRASDGVSAGPAGRGLEGDFLADLESR